jgi:hypothetical protein
LVHTSSSGFTERNCTAKKPSKSPLTLQNILLHLNFIELVGADDEAVVGQMEAAAGLQSLYLLIEGWRKEGVRRVVREYN